MSRKSYPIFQRCISIGFLLFLLVYKTVAQQVIPQQTGPKTAFPAVAADSPWTLLLLIAIIIGFSFVYRRFMYGRLLSGKKNDAEGQASDPKTNAFQSIDGVLEQVVAESGNNALKTHMQLVHNLLHTIDLLQQQQAFFQKELVTDTLHEISQRLYSLTLIHTKISPRGHSQTVDINELVPLLLEHYTEFAGNESMTRFLYSSTSRSVELPVQQALPLTFFINEVLCFFGNIKSENYFSQSVGIYLQETDGHIKLTVRTDGLNVLAEYSQLKRSLQQQVDKHFGESMVTRLTIDQSFGTSIHLQFEKKLAKHPVIY